MIHCTTELSLSLAWYKHNSCFKASENNLLLCAGAVSRCRFLKFTVNLTLHNSLYYLHKFVYVFFFDYSIFSQRQPYLFHDIFLWLSVLYNTVLSLSVVYKLWWFWYIKITEFQTDWILAYIKSCVRQGFLITKP